MKQFAQIEVKAAIHLLKSMCTLFKVISAGLSKSTLNKIWNFFFLNKNQ